MTPRFSRRSVGSVERVLVTLTALVLVLGLGAAVWLAVRGAMAYRHLSAARAALSTVTTADDPMGWTDALGASAEDLAAAHALTDDPVWSAAGAVPWIGPQLTAMAGAAAAGDRALRALTGLGDVASALSSGSLRTPEGGYDVELLASWEPPARAAQVSLADAMAEMSSVDVADALPSVADLFARAREILTEAYGAVDALHRTTQLLPTMLGSERPRSYLVVFQNNAEWRSLGGVVGAVAQIDADDGRLSLSAQASSADFHGGGGQPVATIPDGLRPLFDDRPAQYIQDVTQVPDFAVGAPLAREMWRRQTGTEVDGVIAVDAVALSSLLEATGPVTLPTGDVLTSADAVPLLLDEVYRRYPDPKSQDVFFQSAAAAVFGALAEGRADTGVLVEALARVGSERRLLVWSADPDEQSVLDGTNLQGSLPDSDGGRTSIGVYLNDGTGSKMDYYMRTGMAATWCADGAAGLRVTLRNDAPDPATLPGYVTGGGAYGVPAGQTLSGVYIVLPPDAHVDRRQATGSGAPSGFVGGDDRGREVLKWSVLLAPGESATLNLRIATPPTVGLEVVSTPTLYATEIPVDGAPCANEG